MGFEIYSEDYILGDIKIILQTVLKAFVKQEGITEGDMATAEDFGDYCT